MSSHVFTNYRDKETLIKAYDHDDEIQFQRSKVNRKNLTINISGVSNDD